MQTCSFCKVNKPLEAFALKSRELNTRVDYCRSCKTEYNRKWYQRNKEKQIAAVSANKKKYSTRFYEEVNRLKGHPCTDCGRKFPPCAMDFDHLNPETKVKPVSQMSLHSMQHILEEIAKCELVCAVCHRIRTAERRRSLVEEAPAF